MRATDGRLTVGIDAPGIRAYIDNQLDQLRDRFPVTPPPTLAHGVAIITAGPTGLTLEPGDRLRLVPLSDGTVALEAAYGTDWVPVDEDAATVEVEA